MKRFKVGDRARVIANNSCHGFQIGEEVTISSDTDIDYDCVADKIDNSDYWYLNDDELEPISSVRLHQAMEVIDDYFNAGDKKSRKDASEKAKELYEKYYRKPYVNRIDRD